MNLAYIKNEIVKRADEDFASPSSAGDNYYLERAESHFKAAISGLLSLSGDVWSEQDYPCMVAIAELALGDNCVYPDSNVNDIPGFFPPLYRVLGVSTFCPSIGEYKNIEIVPSLAEFSKVINRPFVQISETSYIHFSQNGALVFPFFDNCTVRYIRQLQFKDDVFEGNLEENFSLRFLFSAIDIATAGFKNEVTVQEQVYG